MARRLLLAEAAAYSATATAFAVYSVRRRGEPLSLIPRVVATFPAFHLAYGLGMVQGFLKAAVER
jgi:hypothetical protein